ncbi:MAG: DUF2142 domain-containing protein [Chloroflexota bacterium]
MSDRRSAISDKRSPVSGVRIRLRTSLILSIYLILALLYAWATPILEASDEYKHVPVIQHIKTTGELVVLDPDNVGKWQQEGAQPPLYYWVVTPFVSWIDTSDFNTVHVENRHAYIGNPNQIYNKNILFHERAPTYFEGTRLMVVIGRLLSIGMGAVTLTLTYRLGRRLFSDQIGWLAAALLAVNPMFLFISASVNNDNLTMLIGVWGTLELVKLWQDEPDPRTAIWRYLYLGLICGLGGLTKLSLYALLLVAGIITAFRAWQRKDPAVLFVGGLSTFLVWLTLVAGWLWRNVRLYGDPIGLNVFVEVQGIRDNPTVAGVDWIGEFGTFYRTLWGLFGGVNVSSPEWFYVLMNTLVILAALGWLSTLWDRKSKLLQAHGAWIPLAMLLIIFGLLLRWTITYYSFQGRLLFPALAGGYVLLAAGLAQLGKKREERKEKREQRYAYQNLSLLILLFSLLLIAVAIPFTHIAPSYQFPEVVEQPQRDFSPIRFKSSSGEIIELVGVDFEENQQVSAGGEQGVDVTLYWRAATPIDTDYVSAVHLLGRENRSVGQVDRHPGWGMWPPTRWNVGEIYADPYRIWVRGSADGPSRLNVSISLFDSLLPIDDPNRRLIPKNENGDQMTLVAVGEAKLDGEGQPALTPVNVQTVDFADFVTLEGYQFTSEAAPGQTLNLDLFWRANGTPSLDYTVFVQLLTLDGEYMAGGDRPPLNGHYPTTLWESGEQIIDSKLIEIPKDLEPGAYQIAVGFYDPQSTLRMERLDGGNVVYLDLFVKDLSN